VGLTTKRRLHLRILHARSIILQKQAHTNSHPQLPVGQRKSPENKAWFAGGGGGGGGGKRVWIISNQVSKEKIK